MLNTVSDVAKYCDGGNREGRGSDPGVSRSRYMPACGIEIGVDLPEAACRRWFQSTQGKVEGEVPQNDIYELTLLSVVSCKREISILRQGKAACHGKHSCPSIRHFRTNSTIRGSQSDESRPSSSQLAILGVRFANLSLWN